MISRCKHDMGALLWLKAEHSKEPPPPAPPLGQTCKLFCETMVDEVIEL